MAYYGKIIAGSLISENSDYSSPIITTNLQSFPSTPTEFEHHILNTSTTLTALNVAQYTSTQTIFMKNLSTNSVEIINLQWLELISTRVDGAGATVIANIAGETYAKTITIATGGFWTSDFVQNARELVIYDHTAGTTNNNNKVQRILGTTDTVITCASSSSALAAQTQSATIYFIKYNTIIIPAGACSVVPANLFVPNSSLSSVVQFYIQSRSGTPKLELLIAGT